MNEQSLAIATLLSAALKLLEDALMEANDAAVEARLVVIRDLLKGELA